MISDTVLISSAVCLCVQVKAVLDEILEKLPEEFNLAEMMGKVEERTPYIVVAFQECERMNVLTQEIKRSLKELNLGLKVRHTHTHTPSQTNTQTHTRSFTHSHTYTNTCN